MKFHFNKFQCAILLNFLLVFFNSCKKEGVIECPPEDTMILEIEDENGQVYHLYNDGNIYIQQNNGCVFIDSYFDPDFRSDNYIETDTGIYIITEDGPFPVKNNYIDDFENYPTFNDMFILSMSDTVQYWTTMTLQSPSAPEVDDYVALRTCIFNQTCDFIDNRIDLISDPEDAANTVVKFTSVPPSENMITAKASMESLISFYEKGDDIWYEADYYILSGKPFTLVDFENQWFLGSPGSRIMIDESTNRILLENKYGVKTQYEQPEATAIAVPMNNWFTIKVHLQLTESFDGLIEIWQDGVLIIQTYGSTIPTANNLLTNVEVGISSTSEGAELLIDNVRVSEVEF